MVTITFTNGTCLSIADVDYEGIKSIMLNVDENTEYVWLNKSKAMFKPDDVVSIYATEDERYECNRLY